MTAALPDKLHIPSPRNAVIKPDRVDWTWVCRLCSTSGVALTRPLAISVFRDHEREAHG